MGEVKAEIREAEAQNRRLKKEVERLGRRGSVNNRSSNGSGRDSVRFTKPVGRSINVEATFYTAFCDTGCIGITKTGLDVRNTIHTPEGLRVIAVDPSVIPLGSTVKVTLANGDSFEAKAEDTGSDIKGARIDVLVSDRASAYKLGRQAATVEIISEGEEE